MQISAAPAPMSGVVTVTPGQLGSQRDYSLPAMLMRLPGVESVSYRIPDRTWYRVNAVDPVFTALASSVLRDTVNGVKILYSAPGTLPTPPAGQTPWWERRLHMIKTIASLPGVHDFRFVGTKAVVFHTANEEATASLRAMVRDVLPDPRETKVHFVVSKNGPEA